MKGKAIWSGSWVGWMYKGVAASEALVAEKSRLSYLIGLAMDVIDCSWLELSPAGTCLLFVFLTPFTAFPFLTWRAF